MSNIVLTQDNNSAMDFALQDSHRFSRDRVPYVDPPSALEHIHIDRCALNSIILSEQTSVQQDNDCMTKNGNSLVSAATMIPGENAPTKAVASPSSIVPLDIRQSNSPRAIANSTALNAAQARAASTYTSRDRACSDEASMVEAARTIDSIPNEIQQPEHMGNDFVAATFEQADMGDDYPDYLYEGTIDMSFLMPHPSGRRGTGRCPTASAANQPSCEHTSLESAVIAPVNIWMQHLENEQSLHCRGALQQWCREQVPLKCVASLPNRSLHSPELMGVTSVSFSPDSKFIAAGLYDGSVRVWNWSSHSMSYAAYLSPHIVTSVAFSPVGFVLAFTQGNGVLCVWEVGNDRKLCISHGYADWPNSVAFHPNGNMLATAGTNACIPLWDTASGAPLGILTGHLDDVTCVTFSPDGQSLASASCDHSVRVWSLETRECVAQLYGHNEDVSSVAYSPDGIYIASGSWQKVVRVVRTSDYACIATLGGGPGVIWSVAFSPDGRSLACSGEKNTLRVWSRVNVREEATWRDASTVTGPGYESITVSSVAFSRTNRWLASGTDDGHVHVWEY